MSATETIQTPHERAAAVRAEMRDSMEAELAAFRPPADDAPPEDPAPAAPKDAPERPATKQADPAPDATRSDSPEDDDQPVTLTRKELQARIEKETARQRNDQSRIAKDLAEARATAATLQSERDQLRLDRQRDELARQAEREVIQAGQTPDREDIRNWAAEQIKQREDAAKNTVQQQAETWKRESATRQTYGLVGYERALSELKDVAREANLNLSTDKLKEIFHAGYADPAVDADFADFRDASVPTEKAQKRADVALARMKDLATRQLQQEAVATIARDRPALPKYDRQTVHGERGGNPEPYRNLTPAEQKARVMAELNEQVEKDIEANRPVYG